MSEITIIGLDGAPYPGSTCTDRLKRALLAAQEAGAKTEHVMLHEIIAAPFHGVHDPKIALLKLAFDFLPSWLRTKIPLSARETVLDKLFTPDILELIQRMERAQGFIFAHPTWWSTPSDQLKILLNYMTVCDYRGNGYSLKGKVAGFIATCEEDGAQLANMIVQNAITHMGMITPPFCSYFFHKGMKGGEENWQETDPELVGVNLMRMCRLLKGEVVGVNWDWNNAAC